MTPLTFVAPAAVAAALLSATAADPLPAPVTHTGMCDASAAVPAGDGMFVAANDEDNVLRVYRADQPGGPTDTFDLNPFLRPTKKSPEADIEGATRVGDRVYWITSHGQNKDGEFRPNRHRLFATDITTAGGKVVVKPVGVPYENLRDDLIAAPGLTGFNLAEAAKRPPKEDGGFNIEGLAGTPDGGLLVAFRNPIPDQKALLVTIKNPAQVIDGKKPVFGDPIQLPLGGRGVRSIEYVPARKAYLMVVGPPAAVADFALYEWAGPGSDPKVMSGVAFGTLRPEALVVFPGDRPKVLALSDDGTAPVDGTECKDAPAVKRGFRSLRIDPWAK